ncbi:MAG: glycosyltransferase [Planctomycetota bacterium]|nr:glycosyltransferase [Planctomycetota bacterium]
MTRHVCIVSNTLADGGAERWASNTCSFLAEAGLRVSLVLFQDIRTYPCPDSVTVTALQHRHFGHAFRTVRRLRKLLIEESVDTVISNGSFTGQFVGEAVRGTSSRWIARISGNIAKGQESFLQRWGWRWLDRNIASASAIVANSANLQSEVQARWPSLSNRAAMIPNGVDVQKLIDASKQKTDLPEMANSETFKIVAAGRLHPQKRPDVFLEMVQALIRDGHEVKAYWCGDGPIRDAVEQQIEELRLNKHVTILGFRRDLPSWIGMADCFVMTSDHEGSPNVIAEAMALGVPVVSTDCDFGPRELLAEGRGWLAPVGDAEQLAASVREVFSESETSKSRASRAKVWIQENLDLHSIGARWEELIEESVAPPEGSVATGSLV